jgi:hypothetical protein
MSTMSCKENFFSNGNQKPNEFLLEKVKEEIREMEPDLDEDSQDFHTAVILLVAALFVGPFTDKLVSFTGYSQTSAEAISRRMHACGLWADGKVCTDGWFNGGTVTVIFWANCAVADGSVDGNFNEAGEFEYSKKHRLN